VSIAILTRKFIAGGSPNVILPENIRTLTEFQPNALQEELLAIKARYQVHYVHRRGGKSFGYLHHAIERGIECPFKKPRYLFTAQCLDQAVDIAWEYLLDIAEAIPGAYPFKRDFSIFFPTRAGSEGKIKLKGTDSVGDRTRGKYLDGVINDEAAFDSPAYWRSQIRPMLADQTRRGFDRHGYANQWSVRISTMNGRNHMYRAHREAVAWMEGRGVIKRDPKSGQQREVFKKPDSWAAIFRTVKETDLIDDAEIEELQQDLTPGEFGREFMLDPDAMVEGAIYADELAKLRRHGLIDVCPHNPKYPVNSCWDIGWHDKAGWFFQIVGATVNWIGYQHWHKKRWHRVVSDMMDKGWTWGAHIFPPDSKHHNSDGQQTQATLKGLGIRMAEAPRIAKQDACETIVPKIILRSRYDEMHCADGLDALALYEVTYDEETELWSDDTSKNWTKHPADSKRYGCCWIDKQLNGHG